MVLWYVLKLATELLVLKPLGRASGACQGQSLLVPGLVPLGRHYKVIYTWLFLVLGLEAVGRGTL